MNWDDWEYVWKRQELPLGAAADVEVLRRTFARKSRKLAKALLVRDVMEASAGVVGCIAFGFMWRGLGRAGWPIGIAMLLILGVTGSFVRERLRSWRNQLGSDAPLLVRIEAEIAELRHQRDLFLGMWRWYLAPIAAAIVIVGFTIRQSRPAWDIARDPLFLGGYFAFVAVLMWSVWKLNLRAVRERVEPRLVELEKLRVDLLAG
jgi:hypothetical protein